MSYYAITMSDGTVAAMQTADDATAPEAVIAKWPPERRAEVVKITPVDVEGYVAICRARRAQEQVQAQQIQREPVADGSTPAPADLGQLRQEIARDLAAAFEAIRHEIAAGTDARIAALERVLAELEPLRARQAELVITADTLRRNAEGG